MRVISPELLRSPCSNLFQEWTAGSDNLHPLRSSRTEFYVLDTWR